MLKIKTGGLDQHGAKLIKQQNLEQLALKRLRATEKQLMCFCPPSLQVKKLLCWTPLILVRFPSYHQTKLSCQRI